MGYFQVRYDSRVIIYDCKMFIRLATGLLVMGRDSRSESCGFESRHHILDGHIFTYICCKNYDDFCLKRPKINEKEAGIGPLKNCII